MSCTVVLGDIYSIPADATINCIDDYFRGSSTETETRLASAAGPELQRTIEHTPHCFVTKNAVTPGFNLPCRYIIHACSPQWLTGKALELKMLRLTYRNAFETAVELGCKSITSVFLSVEYYHFPASEAVHIALSEAANSSLDITFVTENKDLFQLARVPWRKPEIVSYIGYYRDHAIFELDDGRYVRIDIRPEVTDVSLIPYFEPCYRTGNFPAQEPLSADELTRLRAIYENNCW